MGCTATASSNASTILDDEKGCRAFAGPPWYGMRNALVSSRGLRFHRGGDGSIHHGSATSGFLRGGRGGAAVIVAAVVVFVVSGFTTGEQGVARDGEGEMDE